MRLNDFATLERGEKIEVKEPWAGFSVWTVCGEPTNGNTLIDAIAEDGKTMRGIYFRDVIQRRPKNREKAVL